ncbi:MAG TPA: response regulator [Steroidobacteraceae bacterium]|nr:response regulator [Steroidobacteraceae bacterium]
MSSQRSTGKARRAPEADPSLRGLRLEYLTPHQVADRLLVAPVTVRLWASRGLLRSVNTPGGHRRFRVEDVDEFIAKRQQVQSQADNGPSRLLIIDDDAQFARYLSNLIASRAPAIAVEVATDGFSAGIKCEAMRPDVVTLDLQMPDMDGFAVCRLLTAMFGDRKPRIVALSGFLSAENVRRIRAAGADVCLAKTTAPELLIQELGIKPVRPPVKAPGV